MKRAEPQGSLRLDAYYGRYWIKCVDHSEFGTRWVLRSHFVWWRWRHQRVPRGWVLHHKDGDKTRDVVNNLDLLTRAQHGALHGTGSKHTEQTKARMAHASAARCTPEWREAVSKRVKDQHRQGKFGPSTWDPLKKEETSRKISAAHRGKQWRLGKRATPEQRERYKQASLKREAKKRGEICRLMLDATAHSTDCRR